MEIAVPLRYDFPGAEVARTSKHNSPTLFRSTTVADVAVYYGVKPLAEPATLGDMSLKIDSPFGHLVPSAQGETPLVDLTAGYGKVAYIPAGPDGSMTVSAWIGSNTGPSYTSRLYTSRGILPGTLQLSIGGGSYKDKGGILVLALTGQIGGSFSGQVNYDTGEIVISALGGWNATVTATCTPCVAIAQSAGTLSIPVTTSNRAFNYVQTLRPVPTPGSLTVEYRALGKWYTLEDNGLGGITGDTGVGSGSIDYATGSVIVTLGAMPDINSSVTFAWGTPTEYDTQAGLIAIEPAAKRFTLANPPIKPATLTFAWLSNGNKTATVDAAGEISGDAIGTVQFNTGEILFRPNDMPAQGTTITMTYDKNVQHDDQIPMNIFGNTISFTIPNAPLKAGSVRIDYLTLNQASNQAFTSTDTGEVNTNQATVRTVRDNGLGHLKKSDGTSIGTIDYSTGEVSFNGYTNFAEVTVYRVDSEPSGYV